MYRVSIERKMKRFATISALLAIITVASSLIGLYFFTEISIGELGIGAGVAFVVILFGYFIVLSMASSLAAETDNDAKQLSTALSSMASGNFKNTLHTDTLDEIGKIENAAASLAQIQKNLVKDISNFAKRHAQNDNVLIDEKPYSGDFRDMVKDINNTVSSYADSIAAILATLRALAAGEAVNSRSGKSEINNAFDDLRRKLEATNRELQNTQTKLESSQREASNLRDDVAAAKRETSAAKEEANNARKEAAARQVITPRVVTPSKPVVAPVVADKFKSTGVVPLTTKSVKISTPSGAHEYDRKDYGKY